MIINHNCCIKLVPLVIFMNDARSHIHQTFSFRVWYVSSALLPYVALLSLDSINAPNIIEFLSLSMWSVVVHESVTNMASLEEDGDVELVFVSAVCTLV